MHKLLEFLALAVFFIIGYAGFIKWLFGMMSDGGAFDVMFGSWRKMKDRLYNGTAKQKLLENILGGCEQCSAFWWSFPWSVLFLIFGVSVGVWPLNAVATAIWMLVFISICSLVGLKTLTHKKDVV